MQARKFDKISILNFTTRDSYSMVGPTSKLIVDMTLVATTNEYNLFPAWKQHKVPDDKH